MKLKLFNILTVLLISTYVFSTIGVSVIEHYCGGELEEVALFSNPKSCCANEDASATYSSINEDDCCKNKVSHILFHKDFTFKILAKKNTEQNFDLITPLFLVYDVESKSLLINSAHQFAVPKIPPPKLLQQNIVECSVMII